MELINIPFSYNWNNKLDCNAFTTIRIYQPEKHKPGQKVNIVLKGASKGTAAIVEVKPFMLINLNNYMSYLDTGYAIAEAKKIILTMYPTVDFTKKKLAFILIVKDK